jgi:diguanylate cyclase (GGDEF)-like protein
MLGLQMKRSEDEIERLANTDPLTGLLNRRAFGAACEVELARSRRQQTPVSVLVLDIDHFKQVNDRFGHGFGDDVLRAVASRVSDEIRATDVVARVGGEELHVLLPATSSAGARDLAERIRAAVEAMRWGLTDEPDLKVTLSIGIGELLDGESLSDAIARADAALYEAKRQGRNQVSSTVSGRTGLQPAESPVAQ